MRLNLENIPEHTSLQKNYMGHKVHRLDYLGEKMTLNWSNLLKKSGVIMLKARKSIFILGVVFGISILGRMITGYHHKDDLDGFFRIEMPIFSIYLQLSYLASF